MNIISFIAYAFNYILLCLGTLLHRFLQLNFNVATLIVSYINVLKETILEVVLSAFEVFKCCYHDFVIFLYEVISILRFTHNAISIFLCKTYLKVNCFLSFIAEYVYLIYYFITDFSNFSYYCIVNVWENAVYIIHLAFTSVLLILQAGPNILIFLCEFILYCFCYLLNTFKHYVKKAIEDIFYIFSKSSEAIFSVPIKAYFGALMVILIVYQYKYVAEILKMSVTCLYTFLQYAGGNMHNCLHVCLKPFINLFGYIHRKFTKIFLTDEEADHHYDGSHNEIDHPMSQSASKYSFFKYFQGLKSIFNRYPFISKKRVEEQIELLQKELSAEKEKYLCIICCDRPRNTVLIPCYHLILCRECCGALQTQLRGCPLCRKNIRRTYYVYT